MYLIIFLISLGFLEAHAETHNLYTTRAGCGDDKVRGVNLGAWLVLEKWLTPNFFDEVDHGQNLMIDEWTLAQYMDRNAYLDKMVRHWDTFYSYEEIRKLVNAGISHYRIPLPYWYMEVEGPEPFPPPNLNDSDPRSPLYYLLRMLKWLQEFGATAILELHAAPGSQNGYDNSGHTGDVHWIDVENYPSDSYNMARTFRILDKYLVYFRNLVDTGVISMNTIYGIGVLNEPHICAFWTNDGNNWPICRDDYYPIAIDYVRHYFSPDEAKVILDVTGRDFQDFNGIYYDINGIEIDAHSYQCFAEYWRPCCEWSDCAQAHLDDSCHLRDAISRSPVPTWAGEFSLAISQICDYWSTETYEQFLRNFFLAQIDSFEVGRGWVFWNAKSENGIIHEWDYLYLLDRGIVPSNICNRNHYC